MKKNVGKTDRIIRVVIGLAIIGFGLMQQSWWAAIGIIPLYTAFSGVCLAYLPFGLSTCKAPKN